MAHYALMNSDNVVVSVITGVDENIIQTDLDGKIVGGSTEAWEAFYESLPWFSGLKCKRTSYNHRIRKQFAGLNYLYNEEADVFISPKPFASWILDSSFDWQPPKPRPNHGLWIWDEEVSEWVNAESETF